jgi:hypothetical protein
LFIRVNVFLVWHISHLGRDEFIGHRDQWGELLIEEDKGDDAKLLGCYSTKVLAEERVNRSRTVNGFRDEPECFIVSEYLLDHDQWSDGFILIEPDETQN